MYGIDTLIIVILGLVTVILSVYVACWFMRAKMNPLGMALGFQLLGEAVIGAGTLTFAIGAHYGALDSWPLAFQSGLRVIMFLATSITTLHLMREVAKIRNAT